MCEHGNKTVNPSDSSSFTGSVFAANLSLSSSFSGSVFGMVNLYLVHLVCPCYYTSFEEWVWYRFNDGASAKCLD